ncbi:MAG: flagellar assembly protein FliW [Spirochaetes bacterium]|nr:flagellar assembly protein FliW [Spirochaetota bacterium]
MQFDTRALGKIEIETANQIFFPEGLFAFEAFRHFALLPTKSGSTFHWLQSLEDAKLAFLMTSVSALTPTYDPGVPAQYLSLIEAGVQTEAEIWGIITVPAGKPEQMTINLQGPVLINRAKKLGGQFVSEDPTHLVRTALLDLVDRSSTTSAGQG